MSPTRNPLRHEPRQITPHTRHEPNAADRLAPGRPKQTIGLPHFQAQQQRSRNTGHAMPEFPPPLKPAAAVDQVEPRQPGDEMRNLLDGVAVSRFDRDQQMPTGGRDSGR